MSECKSRRQQEDTARSDCGCGHGGPFLSTLDAGDALYRWGRDLASSGINNPNHHIGPAHAVSQTAYARCLCFPGRLPSRAIFPLAAYPPSILVLIWGEIGRHERHLLLWETLYCEIAEYRHQALTFTSRAMQRLSIQSQSYLYI
jgi:hypothetical protein